MEQSTIDKAVASKLAGLAAETGESIEHVAQEWDAEAQRDGNYPEVFIELRAGETGIYHVNPLDPKVLAMARHEYSILFPEGSE